MNDTAQAATAQQRLLQRMRSNFSQPGGASTMATVPAAATPAEPPTTQQPTVHPPVPEPPQQDISLSDDQKLTILDQVLDQVEQTARVLPAPAVQPDLPAVPPSPAEVAPQPVPAETQPVPAPQVQHQPFDQSATVLDQALPQLIQANDPLNPSHAGQSTAKERVNGSLSPDAAVVDVGASMQQVEHEKSPEIPVEVEGYLQKVKDHAAMQPHEIVIADGTTEQSDTAYPSRPVIVLPITEAVEEEGQKKSPKFSVRWLVEWSHKIIKMFAGKVIYKEA